MFTDYAALYPHDGTGRNILHSAGVGLRFQLPYDIAVKTAYGKPLRHNRDEKRHRGDWSVEISFSPDFNRFFNK